MAVGITLKHPLLVSIQSNYLLFCEDLYETAIKKNSPAFYCLANHMSNPVISTGCF